MQSSTHWPFWAGWPLEGMGVCTATLKNPVRPAWLWKAGELGHSRSGVHAAKRVTLAKQTWKVSIHAGASGCSSVLSYRFSFDDSHSLWTKEPCGLQSIGSKVRHYWAAEHALTLFSYAERLEEEPELQCISNIGQKGTEGWFERERERETKLCNWMTNNHTKLPIPSGNVYSVLPCAAQVLFCNSVMSVIPFSFPQGANAWVIELLNVVAPSEGSEDSPCYRFQWRRC